MIAARQGREPDVHQIRISPEAQAFARRQRGGALHMFDRLDLPRTAHVIVDMQNGFVEPGAPVEVPVARDIVDNINAISRAIRAGGGTNVFLQMTVDQGSMQSWSNWFKYFHTAESTAGFEDSFGHGRHYHQLWPEMDVGDGDLFVDKTRFGAFVPGASQLHEVLQARGIDTLIITGTLTNCCCESTARDAMQMNYKLVFVSDANAALTDAAHNATLDNMSMLFADVRPTAEVLEVIGRSAKTPAAAAE
jgi:ureidoacrylate peracid hydrolase